MDWTPLTMMGRLVCFCRPCQRGKPKPARCAFFPTHADKVNVVPQEVRVLEARDGRRDAGALLARLSGLAAAARLALARRRNGGRDAGLGADVARALALPRNVDREDDGVGAELGDFFKQPLGRGAVLVEVDLEPDRLACLARGHDFVERARGVDRNLHMGVSQSLCTLPCGNSRPGQCPRCRHRA